MYRQINTGHLGRWISFGLAFWLAGCSQAPEIPETLEARATAESEREVTEQLSEQLLTQLTSIEGNETQFLSIDALRHLLQVSTDARLKGVNYSISNLNPISGSATMDKQLLKNEYQVWLAQNVTEIENELTKLDEVTETEARIVEGIGKLPKLSRFMAGLTVYSLVEPDIPQEYVTLFEQFTQLDKDIASFISTEIQSPQIFQSVVHYLAFKSGFRPNNICPIIRNDGYYPSQQSSWFSYLANEPTVEQRIASNVIVVAENTEGDLSTVTLYRSDNNLGSIKPITSQSITLHISSKEWTYLVPAPNTALVRFKPNLTDANGQSLSLSELASQDVRNQIRSQLSHYERVENINECKPLSILSGEAIANAYGVEKFIDVVVASDIQVVDSTKKVSQEPKYIVAAKTTVTTVTNLKDKTEPVVRESVGQRLSSAASIQDKLKESVLLSVKKLNF